MYPRSHHALAGDRIARFSLSSGRRSAPTDRRMMMGCLVLGNECLNPK